MREIHVDQIIELIQNMCIKANVILPSDVRCALTKAKDEEDYNSAKTVIDQIIENYIIAEQDQMPICQDTGIACIFIELGQEVHIAGGYLRDAINEGVRKGYEKGRLRKSVVGDPLERINTKDNTPAMQYIDIVKGDQLKITVAPKGFGSENMSAIKMLKPSDGVEGVKKFVLETVEQAGSNPCPPIIVGIGLGGTFDKAALLAKEALLKPVNQKNGNVLYDELENELLTKINSLGIGPQGFGGRTTALGVNIKTMPTHIAGLPCAVNINCHVTRHVTEVI